MLLDGKKGIILGVANNRSIGWGIAESLMEHGAEIAFTYQNDRLKPNLEKLLEDRTHLGMFECDVVDPSSIQKLFEGVKSSLGKVDFLIHSLAYAEKSDLENEFVTTNKENFLKSIEISAYSLVELTRVFLPLMDAGSSIVALTFLGAERTIINYNMMGVSKAALEASVRYLSVDCGKRGVRVNAISAGPVQTLAARGIRNFSMLHKIHPKIAPLGRPISLRDVGGAAVFLCSDLGAGVTSEVLYVDNGFHNVAVGPTDTYNL